MSATCDPKETAAPSEAKPRGGTGRPAAIRPSRKPRSSYPKLRSGADGEARRLCAVILEVLGGGRTPTDAALVLGVSVPRYYALEARALEGLLRSCERKKKGRRRTPEAELEKLRGEIQRLEAERGRLQALLRASQRVAGLPPPPPQKVKGERGKRRKRRPQVRALRAAASLREKGENPLEAEAHERDDAREVEV